MFMAGGACGELPPQSPQRKNFGCGEHRPLLLDHEMQLVLIRLVQRVPLLTHGFEDLICMNILGSGRQIDTEVFGNIRGAQTSEILRLTYVIILGHSRALLIILSIPYTTSLGYIHLNFAYIFSSSSYSSLALFRPVNRQSRKQFLFRGCIDLSNRRLHLQVPICGGQLPLTISCY